MRSIAALIFALVSISASAILVRFSEHELSPYAITFHRFWITALILGLGYGFNSLRRRFLNRSSELSKETQQQRQEPQAIVPRDPIVIWQLVGAGVFLALDLILWAWSLTQTSVASSTLLANLTPFFTCLAGWLICGRTLDRRLVIGGVIAIVGTALLSFDDFNLSTVKFYGDLAALLAAVAFGLYLLVIERLQTKFHIQEIVFWISAIAAALMAPIVVLDPAHFLPDSWQGWLPVVGLALVCQIIGQGLLIYSLNRLSPEFVAVFLLLDPILAAIAAWVLFAEPLTRLSWLAFAVVLVGIYIASVGQAAQEMAPMPVAET